MANKVVHYRLPATTSKNILAGPYKYSGISVQFKCTRYVTVVTTDTVDTNSDNL